MPLQGALLNALKHRFAETVGERELGGCASEAPIEKPLGDRGLKSLKSNHR